MRVLVDTNVLLDVLVKREPFYADSAAIWALAEQGKLDGLVSAISFADVFYMMRRWAHAGAARQAVVLMRSVFTPVVCDAAVINQAIDSGLADFEDALQYYTAVRTGAGCILTRNAGDFPREPALLVLSPQEFLAQLRDD